MLLESFNTIQNAINYMQAYFLYIIIKMVWLIGNLKDLIQFFKIISKATKTLRRILLLKEKIKMLKEGLCNLRDLHLANICVNF